jgi:hypothetical protein
MPIALAMLSTTGCAFGLIPSAGPTLDSMGSPGAEGKVAVFAEAGNEQFGLAMSLVGGAGYLGYEKAAYGMISPDVGIDWPLWDAGQLGLGAFYSARFVNGGGAVNGIGGRLDLLIHVRNLGGEHGSVWLGPMATAEALWVGSATPTRGLFSLMLSLRVNLFDTTRGRWGD